MPTPNHPPPKIVFFDIDDTLYIKDTQSIPDSVSTALHALKNQGIIIAIATGRSLGIIPPPIRQLIDTVGIDYLLTMNGQYNQYQGQKLFDYPLKPEQVLAVLQLFDKHRIATACMTKTEVYHFLDSDNRQAALSSLNIQSIKADKDSFDFYQPIYQILAFYQENQASLLDLPTGIKTTRWHECAVDVLDANSSKARAITALLERLDISPTDAAAFGDGLNDIEMFELVGTAIAMGNAHPDAKQAADMVCPRHDEDGILQAIKQLQWVKIT
ncbi:Cof-type HAD-IIB family hydrolase [Moraxella marmotae]|uniref:Cof-type HAD-IIB family hydrolase n=1 Tax=Moraxella marmotae TaxID=3344520 RepID=UPI0035F46A59